MLEVTYQEPCCLCIWKLGMRSSTGSLIFLKSKLFRVARLPTAGQRKRGHWVRGWKEHCFCLNIAQPIKCKQWTVTELFPRFCLHSFIWAFWLALWLLSGRRSGLMVRIMRWNPDRGRAVLVRVLDRVLRCTLGQDALLSHGLSPTRCLNGYQRM